MKSLAEIFEHTLQDVYYAENAITKALPKIAKAAKSAELKKAAEEHLSETKEQIKKLEQVFKSIGKNASSGCVRFINQDIIDLYGRVNGAAPVFVRANLSPAARMAAVSFRTAEPIDAGVPEGAELLK